MDTACSIGTTTPLTPVERARLRAMVTASGGWVRAARRLRVSRSALERAIGDVGIRSGTIVLLRMALAAQRAQPGGTP
jgi:hypothetical protein